MSAFGARVGGSLLHVSVFIEELFMSMFNCSIKINTSFSFLKSYFELRLMNDEISFFHLLSKAMQKNLCGDCNLQAIATSSSFIARNVSAHILGAR